MDEVEIEDTIVEEDYELAPTETGVIATPQSNPNDILWLAENIEALVEARNKINTAFLRLAKPGDWVTFSSDNDPLGTAELGFAGAFRIASNVGVSWVDRKMRKVQGRDKLGEWYRWEAETTCIFRGNQVRTWGRAGTRDSFFGKIGAKKDASGKVVEPERWKELHELNEGNMKIAAIHGAMKEGVKVLLGLHHFPLADLKKSGVLIDSTKGHSFKGRVDNPDSFEDEQKHRAELRAICLELGEGDIKKAADHLEILSTWEKDGERHQGKRGVDYLKGVQLRIVRGKAQDEYRKKFGKDFVKES